MWYALLADLIVALHCGYVAFIVLGQLAILVGLLLGWSWIRNLWFRLAHLIAITLVALEAIFSVDCPLTLWENDLRILAGQEVSGRSFLGRLLDNIIFYNVDPWIMNGIHIGFATLVIVTFILAPPRWRKAVSADAHARAGLRSRFL